MLNKALWKKPPFHQSSFIKIQFRTCGPSMRSWMSWFLSRPWENLYCKTCRVTAKHNRDSGKYHVWRHKNMSKNKKGGEVKLERKLLQKRWIIGTFFDVTHDTFCCPSIIGRLPFLQLAEILLDFLSKCLIILQWISC